MQYTRWLVLLFVAVVVAYVGLKAGSKDVPMINSPMGFKTRSGASSCPDVSGNVLPACEMERRRPEAGRTYCKRGVCGKGLKAVPDLYTAYMICVPEGKTVDEACPYG